MATPSAAYATTTTPPTTPPPAEGGGGTPAFFSPSEPTGKNIVEASFATTTSPSFEPALYEEKQSANKPKGDDDEEHGDEDGSGFWHLLLSLYLPVALLWLRRSMFGTANLLRSLLLGHVLRMVVGFFFSSDASSSSGTIASGHWWEALWSLPWLQPLLSPRKADPHAWPPPALTVLAILTILAFVVHPDGLTWIMLGKLRDCIVSFFTYLGTCLGTMKDTYGIFPTLLASATLSALVFLGIIVYRTLSPRRRPTTTRHPPKKKKRKGGKGRQRIRHQHNPPSTPRKPSSAQQQGEKTTAPARTRSPSPAPSAPDASSHSEKPARGRIVSTSTLDTFPLADDQSCDESTSVRSIASAPTTTTTFTKPAKQQQQQQQSPIGKGVPQKSKRRQTKKKKSFDKQQPCKSLVEPTSPTLSTSSEPGRRSSTAVRRDGNGSTRGHFKNQGGVPDYRGYSSSSVFSTGSGQEQSQSFFSNEDVMAANQTNSEIPSWQQQQQQQQHAVGYSVPNYGSGHGRYTTPGKLELAAFLARVGLVGTTLYARLLEDLASVDALEWLTPNDYETKYGISHELQREIRFLLEARRQERLWQKTSASSSLVRPPPGLGASLVGDTTRLSETTNSSMVVGRERAASANLAVGPTMASNSLAAPPADSFPAFSSGFRHTVTTPAPSFVEPHLTTTPPLTTTSSPFDTTVEETEKDSSQIEQELQELGGQMVTSVLDC